MPRILIVEDDHMIREALSAGLKSEGYDVVAVSTLAEASRALALGFEGLILDIHLPDGSGFDILENLRRQIRRTILWESFFLALPASFIGVIIGFALNRLLIFQLFQVSAQGGALAFQSFRKASDRILSYLSLPALFLAGLLAFLTILLANMRVAQRLAREPTLSLLKNLPENSRGFIKKTREPRIKDRKRIQWQLPQQSLLYHRHYFRSARLAFTLSFLLLFIMSIYLANVFATNEKYFNDLSSKPQINFSHYSGELLEDDIRQDIFSLPGIENYMENRQLQVSILLPKSAEGEEYHSRGGLASFLDSPHYIQDEGNSWRLSLMLYALPQDLFDAYCTEANISPISNGGDATPVVLYNYMAEPLAAPDTTLSTNQIVVTNLKPGDTLQGRENLFEEELGKKSFQLEVVALTDQLPYAFDATHSATSLKAIVPYDVFNNLTRGFSPDKEMRSHTTTLRLRVDPDQEGALYEKINSLLEKEFSESDYSLTSVEVMRADSHKTLQFMFKVSQLISGFFALFGLISAFATIRQSMLLRQHDFAMLRSVGIDPQGLLGLLMREGFLFFILPFTNALLFSTLFGILILLLNNISPFLLLRFMPWAILVFFTLGVFLVLMGAYFMNLQSFIKKPIASQLRSDILQ